MSSSNLTNEEKQELQQILTTIQKCFQTELFVPINNSNNLAMNLGMPRLWNEMKQTFTKLSSELDTFLKNVSSCTVLTLKAFEESSSKSLNQIETTFKSMANEMEKRVAAHEEAKKKNPYAVGPTKALVTQSEEILGSFFGYFKKINVEFESINEKFIEKGKNSDPNLKGNNSNHEAPIEALEKVKSEVQFLYKNLYGSFQFATYLGLGRLWNEMMQTYQQFSDLSNSIVKNKASCNEKTAGEFYENAMKSAYEIHSSIKEMMDELEKKKNTPICSKSLIIEAETCTDSVIEYLGNIRNQLKIIQSKYPNIKESSFQGFKKEPQFKKVEIDLTFNGLDEFMEQIKLRELLDECLREFLVIDEEKIKSIQINHSSGNVKVILEVLGVAQAQIEVYRQELKRNLEKLVDFNEFNAENSKILKKMLASFSEKYLIFENRRNEMVLVAKATEIKEQIDFINNEIKRNLKPTIKDFSLKQKSQLALSKTFLEKKLKEPGYNEVEARYDEGKNIKITFFGQLLYVNELINALSEFVETLEGKILDYHLSLTDEELSIIEQDEALIKHVESNYNMTVKFNRNETVLAQINIQPHSSLGPNLPEKQIFFETNFNFDEFPAKSIIFFSEKSQLTNIKRSCLLPFIQRIQENLKSNPLEAESVVFKDEDKNIIYINTNGTNPLEWILRSDNFLPNRHTYIFLPDIKSFKLKLTKVIQKLCENPELIKFSSQITFICKKNQDIQSILGFNEGKNSCKPEIQRKWFAVDEKNKLFFSEKGNEKIENAYQKKLKEVELINEDLNLEVATHKLDFTKNIMTHTVTGKEFPITVHPSKITFELCGLEKTVPDSEFMKIPRLPGTQKLSNCEISIGFYHIDLTNKIQTNLFSVYQRKIDSEDISIKAEVYDFTIQYDIKKINLELEYAEENAKNIKTAVSYIKDNLNKKIIEFSQPFDKDFTLELLRKFLSEAKEQNISVYLSTDKKSAVFKAYNEKNIKNFIKMLSYVGKIPIEFPKEWQPQSEEIKTFIVPKNTLEFQNVQKAFTAGNIVELVRIQNKLVFKKFYEEKLCLQELNGGQEVKEKLLYHGTHSTNPKIIYEDKEESFNINYTADRNLLGKGTYFAERSEYSLSYAYAEDKSKSISSMFYCRVLVGESQKCERHNNDIRDTDFKDTVKRIRYESMTDFLQGSNVYVVFKNRRAYPLYLIKYVQK